MAVVQNIYSIYAASINGTPIPMTQYSIDPAIQPQLLGVNGQIVSTMVFVPTQSPTITFTTPAIKAILDIFGDPWQGKAITTVVFYLQKHTPDSVRSTDADFQSFTVADGVFSWQTINANQGAAGSIACSITPRSSDGEVLPIIIADDVADPSLTIAIADAWSVGPVKINSASIEAAANTGVQSIVVNSGLQVQARGGDGAPFDTFVSVMAAQPTIQVGLSDGLTLKSLGLGGTPQDDTDESVIFLRKIKPNASMVAKDSATHISFAVEDGIIAPQAIAGTHGEIVGGGFIITPVLNITAAVAQIVVDTTTVIS